MILKKNMSFAFVVEFELIRKEKQRVNKLLKSSKVIFHLGGNMAIAKNTILNYPLRTCCCL